jgi:hypothetical protein
MPRNPDPLQIDQARLEGVALRIQGALWTADVAQLTALQEGWPQLAAALATSSTVADRCSTNPSTTSTNDPPRTTVTMTPPSKKPSTPAAEQAQMSPSYRNHCRPANRSQSPNRKHQPEPRCPL